MKKCILFTLLALPISTLCMFNEGTHELFPELVDLETVNLLEEAHLKLATHEESTTQTLETAEVLATTRRSQRTRRAPAVSYAEEPLETDEPKDTEPTPQQKLKKNKRKKAAQPKSGKRQKKNPNFRIKCPHTDCEIYPSGDSINQLHRNLIMHLHNKKHNQSEFTKYKRYVTKHAQRKGKKVSIPCKNCKKVLEADTKESLLTSLRSHSFTAKNHNESEKEPMFAYVFSNNEPLAGNGNETLSSYVITCQPPCTQQFKGTLNSVRHAYLMHKHSEIHNAQEVAKHKKYITQYAGQKEFPCPRSGCLKTFEVIEEGNGTMIILRAHLYANQKHNKAEWLKVTNLAQLIENE